MHNYDEKLGHISWLVRERTCIFHNDDKNIGLEKIEVVRMNSIYKFECCRICILHNDDKNIGLVKVETVKNEFNCNSEIIKIE